MLKTHLVRSTKSKTPSFKYLGLLFLLLTFYSTAFAQLVPISLDQRIDKSTQIFEGEVVSKNSYWDDDKKHIYTVNVINVYKVFKGASSQKQIEVITKGGIVGDVMEEISHSLQLNVGDAGIFTAIESPAKLNTNSKLTRLKAYAEQQGFIKYNLSKQSAEDVFNTYKSISKDVYPKIKNRTKISVKVVQKDKFNLK